MKQKKDYLTKKLNNLISIGVINVSNKLVIIKKQVNIPNNLAYFFIKG